MADKSNKVRYRVVKPCFVNGSYVDPKGRKDVFVEAAPGLEGSALMLAPKAKAPTGKAKNGEKPADNASGDAEKSGDTA